MRRPGRPPREPIPSELAYGLAWNESERSGVDFVKLMGQCREDDVARARWRVFAQLHAIGYSYPQIADIWGMDRTSVLYGVRELKAPTSKRATIARPPKPEKQPRPDNTERFAKICEMYDTGVSLAEVGKHFGITRERVRQILVKAGKYDRHQGVMMPDRVAARERTEERLKRREERQALRTARKAKCLELYQQGRTYNDIAAELGVSVTYVVNYVGAAGLFNRYPSTVGRKKRLTDEQKRQIGERYAAGDDYREIAKTFDISPKYVSHVAIALGFYRPVPERKPRPAVDRERHPGVAKPKLLDLLTGAHWNWSEDDLRRVQEMSAAGASASEIGRAVGRSRNAIIGLWGRARQNNAAVNP